MVVLAVAKGIATALCLGSGFGGGIFSLSLVLGAMLGSAFGLIAAGVPRARLDLRLCAPGMGALAAACAWRADLHGDYDL